MSDTGFINLRRTYEGRRVLVTGHTGFKGSWLLRWLLDLGARIDGVALGPDTQPSLFESLGFDHAISSHILDIRDGAAVGRTLAAAEPEIVFHLAAQPLVRRSYADPIGTFATNVMGTAHVLEACRNCPTVKAVVCVTTDKVYRNREWPWAYRESDELGGLDPYSASKACAELVATTYQTTMQRRDSPFELATARGGNVVGGGDWAQDRVVPDIVRALQAGAPVVLRNPAAVRPWQHVLELCEGYLELGARLLAGENDMAQAWNFGPRESSTVPVRFLADRMLAAWGKPDHPVSINGSPLHEAQILRLDIAKAVQRLHWRPRLTIAETLQWTAEWYKAYQERPNAARDLTSEQIHAFDAKRRHHG